MLRIKENTWKYADLDGTSRPIVKEPEEIAQRRAKALHSITMSCREHIFNELVETDGPRVAWNTLKDRYQKANNASRLMLLDKLNAI